MFPRQTSDIFLKFHFYWFFQPKAADQKNEGKNGKDPWLNVLSSLKKSPSVVANLIHPLRIVAKWVVDKHSRLVPRHLMYP